MTGAAEAALLDDGTFELPPPQFNTAGVPTLTAAEARTLTGPYPVQYWELGLDVSFERGHGSPVELEGLSQCGRVLFANTPLSGVPPDWDPVARRILGEWWLIAYCGRTGELQGHVAISAYATDLRIEDPWIVFPLNHGSEFQDSGVPGSWQAAVPYSPEGAVAAAWECTHRLVTEVPWLLLQAQYPTTVAKWRVQLAAPVELEGAVSGERHQATEVYVGLFLIDPESDTPHYEARVGVATADQPEGISFGRRTNPLEPNEYPPPGYEIEVELTDVPRVADRPIAFEPVTCR